MPGKYQPLEDFLRKTPNHVRKVTLSFDQVEMIIRFSLPEAAYTYRQWWENQTDNKGRPQAKAWMGAGFKTSPKNINNAWVEFART